MEIRAALKARVILRQLFGGKIVLRPGPDRSLWAEYEVQPGALIREQVVERKGIEPSTFALRTRRSPN
jgi:hypothetical protein